MYDFSVNKASKAIINVWELFIIIKKKELTNNTVEMV